MSWGNESIDLSTFWLKVFVNNTKKNEMLILFDVLPQKKIKQLNLSKIDDEIEQ